MLGRLLQRIPPPVHPGSSLLISNNQPWISRAASSCAATSAALDAAARAQRSAAAGLTQVKDLLESDRDRHKWTVSEDASVFDATRTMVEHKRGSLCVTRGGKIVGIVTERDYLRKVVHEGRTSKKTTVKEIATMGSKLCVASLEDTILDCIEVMGSRGIRHLPVADQEGEVMGLISISDIARALYKERENTEKKLDKLVQEKSMPVHDG